MAEETKTAETNEKGQVIKQETVEVLDSNGNTLSGPTALGDIFSKIEAGKEEGKTAAEVVRESAAEKPQEKPVEKEVEKPEEKKVPEEVSDLDKKLQDSQQKKDDAEASREALRAQTEDKKPDDKKEAEKPVEKLDEVPADELQVLPHDKPKTAKRITALLNKVKCCYHDQEGG